jgi:hypothetical protein
MATEEIKELPKSWAMVGGDGLQSYTQNSSYRVHILPLCNNNNNSNTKTLWLVRQNSLSFLLRFFFFFHYLMLS